MVTIAIANQKGGVGKTTIAFNLAQLLSRKRHKKVLAIDNDPQGNCTASFIADTDGKGGEILDAYDGKPLQPVSITKSLYLLGANINLAPVAEREFSVIFKLKEALGNLTRQDGPEFDYILIDCLPSFGHLHLAALNAADYLLIPVKPAPYAMAGMNDLFKTIEKIRKYFNPELKILGIVINQVDGRNLVLQREMESALREAHGNLVFKSKIKKRIKLEESPVFHKSILQYDPKGPAAEDFKALGNELIRRLNKNGKRKKHRQVQN
jgi:chromosome partitioning protein